ncbi:MAG: hypothetical protein WCP98_04330 [Actinomycetes bacterium]
MTKGLSFDELYPGTYVKAGEFNGKPATLTIKSVSREMLSNGTGGEEGAVIVAFAESEKLFVMNKTNAVCLRAMWGDDSGEWAGHKVTLHPIKDESGLSESGLCIRVKGSPELTKPINFKARLGRKMVAQTLVPTGRAPAPAPAPAHVLPNFDEDTGEVFGFEDEAPYAEDPASSTQQGQLGDAEANSAPHASEPETAPESPADDDDVPGRGPLFAVDDPNRPASGTDKRPLSEALQHVPTEATKEYRKRFGGRTNSELSHGDAVAFLEWAVKEAKK